MLVVLICSTQESLSQGRDRTKFQSGIYDTSGSYLDTSLISDTTNIRGPVDSTARVNNFKYNRTDDPIPDYGEMRSPLLLYNSQYTEFNVTFDSLNNVIITESFDV